MATNGGANWDNSNMSLPSIYWEFVNGRAGNNHLINPERDCGTDEGAGK
jgi:hypothetical protein